MWQQDQDRIGLCSHRRLPFARICAGAARLTAMNHQTTVEQALTLRNVRRDFPEWHRGRPAYALWALDFDTTAVLPHMAAAQAQLADLLLQGYCRQPHITLSLCGFPSGRPRLADDFGSDLIQAQVVALQLARPTAFDIEMGGLATFSSVPYFRVVGAYAQIGALRACLQSAHPHAEPEDYTPHVTVGLYCDAWPMATVEARLNRCVLPPALRLRVRGLRLLTYAAHEIGGQLQQVAAYDFKQATLRWQGAPLFAQAPADGGLVAN